MPASPTLPLSSISLTRDGYCDVEEVGENIRISIGTEPKSVRASITIDRAGARALGLALVAATDNPAGGRCLIQVDNDATDGGTCALPKGHRGECLSFRESARLAGEEYEEEPDDEHGLADMHDEGDATPDGPVL